MEKIGKMFDCVGSNLNGGSRKKSLYILNVYLFVYMWNEGAVHATQQMEDLKSEVLPQEKMIVLWSKLCFRDS